MRSTIYRAHHLRRWWNGNGLLYTFNSCQRNLEPKAQHSQEDSDLRGLLNGITVCFDPRFGRTFTKNLLRACICSIGGLICRLPDNDVTWNLTLILFWM